MAATQENIKSYRIVWKISEKRKNSFSYLKSYEFTIDNSKWTLDMHRFPDCPSEYSFSLCGPSKDNEKILKSSYYLLSTDKNHKFENFSKYSANTTPDTKITQNEAMLVCAIDVSCTASERNSEKWLEGRTQELDLVQNPISSGNGYKNYSIQCNDALKEMVNLTLVCDSETSTVKSIATGLNNGECIIVDWCSGSPFCIGPNKTTLETNLLGNEIIVWCKSFEFKEMTKNRKSEIAGIIQSSFSDSLLMSKDCDDGHQTWEPTQYRYITKFQTIIHKVMTAASAVPSSIVHTKPVRRCSSNSPSDPKILSNSMQSFRVKQSCNITIKVLNGGYSFRAHKQVLVSGSTVWRQLLTNDPQLSIITVPDLDRKVVKALITFIYNGSVPKSTKDTDQLLIAAVTYGVDDLKDWCEQQLMHTITIESAVNLMVLAHRYKASTLFETLVTFLQENFAELEQRDKLKSLFEKYPESAMELLKKLCSPKSLY